MPSLPIRNRSYIQFLDWTFSFPTQLNLTYRPVGVAYPTPTGITQIPSFGGLYAVMVYDAGGSPKPYRLIYVGESANLADRVCSSHEKYPSWIRAASGAQLFVAFSPIVGEAARKSAARQIITHYGPECNKTFNRNMAALRALGMYSDAANWPFNLSDLR